MQRHPRPTCRQLVPGGIYSSTLGRCVFRYELLAQQARRPGSSPTRLTVAQPPKLAFHTSGTEGRKRLSRRLCSHRRSRSRPACVPCSAPSNRGVLSPSWHRCLPEGHAREARSPSVAACFESLLLPNQALTCRCSSVRADFNRCRWQVHALSTCRTSAMQLDLIPRRLYSVVLRVVWMGMVKGSY